MRKLLAISFGMALGALALTGCKGTDATTGQPVTSGVAVVDVSISSVEQSFTLGMQLANLYTSLPRCGKTEAKICSDVKVVRMIREYAIKAHNALLMARENQNLIGAAVSAVNEFNLVVPKS